MNTLYRMFHNDELLYVGISMSPIARWKQHQGDKDWFTEITHITVEHYETRLQVAIAESLAIEAEKPKYNKVMNKAYRYTDKRKSGKGNIRFTSSGRVNVRVTNNKGLRVSLGSYDTIEEAQEAAERYKGE